MFLQAWKCQLVEARTDVPMQNDDFDRPERRAGIREGNGSVHSMRDVEVLVRVKHMFSSEGSLCQCRKFEAVSDRRRPHSSNSSIS